MFGVLTGFWKIRIRALDTGVLISVSKLTAQAGVACLLGVFLLYRPFFTILIFIVVSYAGELAAECANETSADSKLRL